MFTTGQHKSNASIPLLIWMTMIVIIYWLITIIAYTQLPASINQTVKRNTFPPPDADSRQTVQQQLNRVRARKNTNHAWYAQREQIKQTFLTAWNAYKQTCFGEDELFPNTATCRNWIGLGLTILDAMDTMYIMNIDEEYELSKAFVSNSLSFNKDVTVSFFETVIRCVGSMISLYDLTEDELYLRHLRTLMDNLLPAFNTQPLGFPASDINLWTGNISITNCDGACVVFADIASIQLEFNAACDRLQDYKYCALSDHVLNVLDPKHAQYGMKQEPIIAGHYPILIRLNGTFGSNIYRWGAMGDSAFEYLLKQWIYEEFSRRKRMSRMGYFYSNARSEQYRRMYETAVDAMLQHLYKFNNVSKLHYIAEIEGAYLKGKMDELACFVGGNLALASQVNITNDLVKSERYLNAAIELTNTCYQMWHQSASGLAPEYVVFNEEKGMFGGSDADYYLLRPETIESIFYLYRITKDEKYRRWGWEIYEAIERNCHIKQGRKNSKGIGYAPVNGVSSSNARVFTSGLDHVMVMHSFFLAETLKYLFLLFSDEQLLPLDRYVFNTEAHPILL